MKKSQPSSLLVVCLTAAAVGGCSSQKESAVTTAPAPTPIAVQTTTSVTTTQSPAAAPAASPAPAATASAPAAAPTAPAPAASAAPAAGAAGASLASADGERPGLRVEVTELKHSSDNMLKLKFTFINDSDQPVEMGAPFLGTTQHGKEYRSVSGVTLFDEAGKKKYFVVRDSEDTPLCSIDISDVAPHTRTQYWSQFPAPPATVQNISISVPHFEPMTKVPVSQ